MAVAVDATRQGKVHWPHALHLKEHATSSAQTMFIVAVRQKSAIRTPILPRCPSG